MTNKIDHLKELEIMKNIAEELKNLEPNSIRRILEWASDHFGIEKKDTSNRDSEQIKKHSNPPQGTNKETQPYKDVADFYSSVSPKTEAERVLTISYWKQYIEGAPDVDALSVNNELKDLGHVVSNITRAFNNLKQMKPQLAIQLKKQGSTKQARKKYRVTDEGRKYIDNMLKPKVDGIE